MFPATGVDIAAEVVQVEWNLARCMCAIDDGEYSGLAGAAADFFHRGESFVSGLQGQSLVVAQAAGDHVDRRGRVGEVNDFVCVRAEVGCERSAGVGEEVGGAASEKFNRLALEFALPALVFVEHRFWTCAEGAVVEEDDVGVEEEQMPEEGGHAVVGLVDGQPVLRRPAAIPLIVNTTTSRSSSAAGLSESGRARRRRSISTCR